jgi:hypothetical protein
MTEHDGEQIIPVQDADILEVIEDADALLARLVADGELLTGGRLATPRSPTRTRPRRHRGRRR